MHMYNNVMVLVDIHVHTCTISDASHRDMVHVTVLDSCENVYVRTCVYTTTLLLTCALHVRKIYVLRLACTYDVATRAVVST